MLEQYTLSNSFDSIVIVNRDGGNPHRIDDAADASWSPDGTQLAFTRPRPSTEDVVVVNADGTGERVLAANAGLPDWSPDGTKLAFVGRSGIEVIGAMGRTGTRLPPGSAIRSGLPTDPSSCSRPATACI